MTHTITITPTWAPLVDPLVGLLARAASLEARDAATTELRRLLEAAGGTPGEIERTLIALAADPDSQVLRERLHEAARRVDARAAEGVV